VLLHKYLRLQYLTDDSVQSQMNTHEKRQEACLSTALMAQCFRRSTLRTWSISLSFGLGTIASNPRMTAAVPLSGALHDFCIDGLHPPA
jgi:hypothetical protein